MERNGPPPTTDPDVLRQTIEWALVSRRSIRAYLPTPVPQATVESILDVARFAATGVNLQPWRVHVVMGAARQRISAAIQRVHDLPELDVAHQDAWDYYPREWTSPYLDRKRAVGWQLYGLLGIEKGDKVRMHAQHGRNYRFFDAPVGLFFTIDRVMQQGGLLDYGMFLQNIMIAARAHGLSTCPQAAFMKYHALIADELRLAPNEMLVVGMSLGYADPASAENTLETERAPVATFTTFHTT
ncbi:nitroreductase [Paraburkholderia pallida]|uniref:Nitroreductase n=1 Tax=Paraburkholderia pallida TaxID=2547399 RepID=A0A4P7D3X4_9BURK|nr:nitroreductase [Paraburkholderia pallida]QBR01490.1 nitroreductase [Paraburkholderia pallida]